MNYPDKFDLDHMDLSSLINNAALALDNSITKGSEKTDYTPVNKLADILRETSKELRIAGRSYEMDLVHFFYEIFSQKETPPQNITREQAKELIDLSEELALASKLPRKRIRTLREFCNYLSKATSDYWNIHNLNGFKRSAQH